MTALNMNVGRTETCDVLVLGAGLIGLSIALELSHRGARVVVLDQDRCLSGASIAAAGMLAVEDPCNPPELLPLSRLSIELYPNFLRQIECLSGLPVPFQTERTIQWMSDGTRLRLAERSIDPRQLATALRAAIMATPIKLIEEMQVTAVEERAHDTMVQLRSGASLIASRVVFAAGVWTPGVMRAFGEEPVPITPRKGQMLRVSLPSNFKIDEVQRNDRIYVVPRTHGPQAGTALIGATVEHAGFDTEVHSSDLLNLRSLAAELVPEFASTADATTVESWAGLRPATLDLLPVLGQFGGASAGRCSFIASGHYRNGILLAPATAAVIADLIEERAPAVDLALLSPIRFARLSALERSTI
ncbi:MAG: FAD-dependent oxidoreductase [Acidobacteriaceae bacterium]